ncbi:hypothetical protein PPL_06668 [Heterostelium album PN500]|uniref:Uncharacterized protein n=1 Tax=Heterostelium pallidum (strain ATCC 26659 / Pp 5 / PN500) TaxID=670386 RepID=D3BFD5_HETP5|nr:hypothetical protein PPL_06668 [Heterostelium album PN500]EFA79849.1 hypothetical protein PPL_06668 [Heterostelium album PN500]|eukprot:XP_020431970.1 hypothetical protein PPL_06668 [Heterostelium album PN500]
MTYHAYVSKSDWDLLKQIFNLEYVLLDNNSAQFEIDKQVIRHSDDDPYKCYSNQFNIDPIWIQVAYRCQNQNYALIVFQEVILSSTKLSTFQNNIQINIINNSITLVNNNH